MFVYSAGLFLVFEGFVEFAYLSSMRNVQDNYAKHHQQKPAALAYYLPIAFITYYLLFKIKKKGSFYAAVAVSVATLFMVARNFLASLNNFGPGIIPQYSPNPSLSDSEVLFIWASVVAILGVLNIVAVKSRKIVHA
jgi:hypothetical protein